MASLLWLLSFVSTLTLTPAKHWVSNYQADFLTKSTVDVWVLHYFTIGGYQRAAPTY